MTTLFWILVKANNAASDQDKIPESELVAQVSYVLSLFMVRKLEHSS